MFKSLLPSCVFLLLALSGPVTAQRDLTGNYVVVGTTLGGGGSYRGKAAVAATGATYQVAWLVGGAKYRGTGILEGDVFSVVYHLKGSAPGVAVYKVESNGVLTGRWTSLAGTTLGTENWKPDTGI